MPETTDPVRQLILQDHHVTYREIETTLDISAISVIAWIFDCQKNLLALDLTQFANRSKKGLCRGISGASIHSILHEHLTVKKICSRWKPHNLSIAQQKTRVDWLKEMLQKHDRGASKHVYDIVTGDEWWIYAYEPESKQQSTV